MKKSLTEIVNQELCTGCGTCASLCPKEAVDMVRNQFGWIPTVNPNKCNNCGTCSYVCPGYSVDFKKISENIFEETSEDEYIGNYLRCYTGYSKNYDVRHNSSSGGTVTELLVFALEEKIIDGVLVTRMSYKNPLEAESFIATTREDIINASKSKYCPVPVNISLKRIIESENNSKFAVVGLPCHIHGIRKAEQINKKLKEKIALHIGIFCGHTPNFLATEFLFWQMGLKRKNIKKLDYRGNGWPGEMQIALKNSEVKIKYEKYWNKGFGKYFIPKRCTLCRDGVAELADISFGDAWLAEIKNKDAEGTSIIISRTRKAEEILKYCVEKGKITTSLIRAEKVIESQRFMLNFKKKSVKAHTEVLKLFKYDIPIYNIKELNCNSKQYIDVIIYYILHYASSRKLWLLLNCHSYMRRKIIRIGGYCIRKLKNR